MDEKTGTLGNGGTTDVPLKEQSPSGTPEEYAIRRARETGQPYAVGTDGDALEVATGARHFEQVGIRLYAPAPGREATTDEVSRFCRIDRLGRQMAEDLGRRNPDMRREDVERVVYNSLVH